MEPMVHETRIVSGLYLQDWCAAYILRQS